MWNILSYPIILASLLFGPYNLPPPVPNRSVPWFGKPSGLYNDRYMHSCLALCPTISTGGDGCGIKTKRREVIGVKGGRLDPERHRHGQVVEGVRTRASNFQGVEAPCLIVIA